MPALPLSRFSFPAQSQTPNTSMWSLDTTLLDRLLVPTHSLID
jgi:hypothetical protein